MPMNTHENFAARLGLTLLLAAAGGACAAKEERLP
jgi:hypothetical protein